MINMINSRKYLHIKSCMSHLWRDTTLISLWYTLTKKQTCKIMIANSCDHDDVRWQYNTVIIMIRWHKINSRKYSQITIPLYTKGMAIEWKYINLYTFSLIQHVNTNSNLTLIYDLKNILCSRWHITVCRSSSL